MIDFGLYTAYLFFFAALLGAVGFAIFNASKSPGTFKKSLIGVGALVGLFIISYLLTGSAVSPEQAAKGITESSSKLIGAGLTMLYLSMAIAFVGIIYSEISKALK
ncbi:MAG: hypothetical protein O9340_15315 [Cyclobacteriaceae bacterium]|jgi:hypothetical protein|nr:hypothetical protein [Cyclobacteriaceae bacterium]